MNSTLTSEMPESVGEAEELAAEFEDVELAQAGDRRAFARLYRAYGPMVHGILLSRVSQHDVADLVQEVFVTGLRRLAQLKDPQAFGGWLATIARNHAVDHQRRVKPVAEYTETTSGVSTSLQAEALRVLARIRALPETYRETLTLRLVEGMTGPEISIRTGLTPGSVRVNLHRGMKLLRAALEGGHSDE